MDLDNLLQKARRAFFLAQQLNKGKSLKFHNYVIKKENDQIYINGKLMTDIDRLFDIIENYN
jgi:hypothetical protein